MTSMKYQLFTYEKTERIARSGISIGTDWFDLGDVARMADCASLAAASLVLRSPFGRPGAIYAAGANYRDHVEAMGRAFNQKLVLDPKKEGVPRRSAWTEHSSTWRAICVRTTCRRATTW